MSQAITSGARGGSLTVLSQIAKFAIQFASVIVLSRLLAPEDFGLVAMVGAFLAFGDLLRDFGMTTIGLQRETLTRQDASNLFWISAALGVGSAVVVAALTPLLVFIYDEPRLWVITPALALTLALNGLGAQLQVQLARGMRFIAISVTDLSAQLSGLIVAVLLAIGGFGYWALVAQAIFGGLVLLASRALILRWIPGRPRRDDRSRGLFVDGFHFGFASFLTYAASNVDTVVIGAQWGPTYLGVYNRAYQLLALPVARLLSPLTDVVVPTLNRSRAHVGRIDQLLLKIQFAIGFVVVGAFAVSAAVADQLIPIVLGDQWRASSVLFQILAVGGAVQVFSYVSYWRFVLDNLGRRLVTYNLVTKTLSIALIIFAAPVGVEAIAWAISAGLVVSWPINLVWLRKYANQEARPYLANGLTLLSAGGVAFVVGRIMTVLTPHQAVLQLFLGLAGGLLAYILAIAAFRGSRTRLWDLMRFSLHVARSAKSGNS